MKKPTKPSAADRTIDLFQAPVLPAEPEDKEELGTRQSLEEDVDRLRENAFKGQEWTTEAFGKVEATGNEYRISHKGQHYYLETLHKIPGAKESHAYSGLMVHDSDLLKVATVIVAAVRAKQGK